MVDADDRGAINSTTGFITECARSFWTPSIADNYWAFKPQGGCLAQPGSDISNYPDGNIVEKGAQAYKLRTSSTRTIKTCNPSSCTSLINFDASNTAITSSLLGITSTGTTATLERAKLISWATGAEVLDENLNGNLLENRPSIHGDVVHSRPAAINYGNSTNPDVVVFYGGNDGLLHAIRGNREGNGGTELWSFMPPEFYPGIKRLYDNAPAIKYPGQTLATSQPKTYGMDGSVGAVVEGSNTWIYGTMRRGGRLVYAFDVSTPSSPSLKWRIGCPNAANDTGCTSGFSDIGQTWATPKAFKAASYKNGDSSILVMGGGYSSCEDNDPATCTSTKGNRIYFLDADTGALLKTFNTDRAVVGDVALLTDIAGKATYGYAADLGGNLYRISGDTANKPMGSSAPSTWTLTKIASLGCDTTSGCSPNRKFLYGPEVASAGDQAVIVIGSGDREKPLSSYTAAASVANRFYSLRDKPNDATWLDSEITTCGSELICNDSLLAITDNSTPSESQLASKPKGWYLGLNAQEQVVTSALIVYGNITFSTHQPVDPVTAANSCAPGLGTARTYNLNYKDASANGERFSVIAGGGLPPSPVAGVVEMDDGTQRPFIIGGGCADYSPLEACEPIKPTSPRKAKSWVFWNIER